MGSTLALIALGSNLGDRKANLDRAIAELAGSPGVVVRGLSRYHETPPVGGPNGQGSFLNAAAALETILDPAALHRLLIEVEQQAGRVREVRWDARTLDLDLILFGDQVIDTPELVVPHPRFAVRRFVLDPLAEVAPDARDPITYRTVLELLLHLDRRPSSLAIDGTADPGLARQIAAEVAAALGGSAVFADEASPLTGTADDSSGVRLERLRRLSKAIRSERDRVLQTGEPSWVVSDFFLAGELWQILLTVRAEFRVDPGDESIGRAWGDAHTFSRDEAPAPTIAVLLGWQGDRESLPRPVSGAPQLVIDRTDRAGIVAEILAACEASRARSVSP